MAPHVDSQVLLLHVQTYGHIETSFLYSAEFFPWRVGEKKKQGKKEQRPERIGGPSPDGPSGI
jgi:hypothetical protein